MYSAVCCELRTKDKMIFSEYIVTSPLHLNNHSKLEHKLNAGMSTARPFHYSFFPMLTLNQVYKHIKQGEKSET